MCRIAFPSLICVFFREGAVSFTFGDMHDLAIRIHVLLVLLLYLFLIILMTFVNTTELLYFRF